MLENREYYLIAKEAIPETLLKAYKVKQMLDRNKDINVKDAVNIVGISRSAFYKYKDMIEKYSPIKMNKIVTLFMELEDVSGNLSSVLKIIAKEGANVLTINQNIPINGKANISISIDTQNVKKDFDILKKKLMGIEDIRNLKIAGNE